MNVIDTVLDCLFTYWNNNATNTIHETAMISHVDDYKWNKYKRA